MTRSLAALVCFGALFSAPSRTEAGVIPWIYDSIFGYGGNWGYGGGWGASYGGYTTGYAPFYSGSYGIAYGGGGACCGTTTNYAPWTGYSNACCAPCGSCCASSCGSACGTGCDPGCSNCAGGNCGTGSSGTNAVPSTPTDSGTGQQPTYAPKVEPETKTPPQDQFGPARDRAAPGSSVPPAGGFTNPAGSAADPNSGAPIFAPREPSGTRSGDPDARRAPARPAEGEEKIAFKTPARFTRTTLQPVFELPTIVNAPPRTTPDATAAPTAVASK